jgi:sugar/nucleoside kinase (ribokinase family)
MLNSLASGSLAIVMNRSNLFDLSGVPVVVGTGLVALDVVINHAAKSRQKLFAGGTCGNVLSILSYLGWDAYPVARMNRDAASKHVLKDFKKCGVHTELSLCLPSGDTPIIIHNIRRAPDGRNFHRFSFTCPNCGAWLPGFKPVTAAAVEVVLKKIPAPNVFFFDRLSRAAVNLARAYTERGSLVVFEPSGFGDPKLFREALSHAHILKYSNERLNEMSDLQLDKMPLLTIETLESEGLRYRSTIPSCRTLGWRSLDAFSLAEVKDAAGAGDWCTAGLIHLLGAGGASGLLGTSPDTLRQAMLFGQALAAWNCQFEGARGGVYLVDRQAFRRQVNQILFGKAHKLVTSPPAILSKGIVFKCMAPACRNQSRIRTTDYGRHRPTIKTPSTTTLQRRSKR